MLLNKKYKTLIVSFFVFTLLIQISYAEICETARAKDVLRKNIYLYLTNPSASPLTIEKLKDLLKFYIELPSGITTFDCSAIGATTSTTMSTILRDGDAAPNTLPSCSDGAKYGECSSSRPKYCYSGSLINKCDFCGCPSTYSCNSDGSCSPAGSNITCFNNIDCGQNQFTGNYYCSNSHVNRNYLNYTCLNPGTANSSCASQNYGIVLAYCDPSLNQSCVNGSASCQTKITNQTTCSDGTSYNQCSPTKPFYCSNGTLINNCSSCGCSSNQTCLVTGACQQPDACADSDNGINQYFFGYAYGFQNGSFKNQSDNCASNTTLTEAVCAGNKISTTIVVCSYQCANGICINLSNQNPNAVITTNVTKGNVPLVVLFNATLSSDPDGSISNYSWSFGDGYSSILSSVAHNYATAGIYNANLTVTDNLGAKGYSLKMINVTINQNPVAIILANITGINLTVKFNGTASYDSDGYIVSYNWSFGDGNKSSFSTITYKYRTAGIYLVNLTVVDNNLAYGNSTKSINVT